MVNGLMDLAGEAVLFTAYAITYAITCTINRERLILNCC